MQELDSTIHGSRGQLLQVQKIIAGAGQRLGIHRPIEVEPDEYSRSGGEMLVEAEHGGIFKDVLPALAREFIDVGIAGRRLALRISVENGNELGGIRGHLGFERSTWNIAEQRKTPILTVAFVGQKEKSPVVHDRSADGSPELIQMKRRLRGSSHRNRLQSVKDIIAEVFEGVAVKLI